MKKYIGITLYLSLFCLGQVAHAQDCDTGRFWMGEGAGTVYASSCTTGIVSSGIESTLENWLKLDLNMLGSYEQAAGIGFGDLSVTSTNITGLFNWDIAPAIHVSDAVFVVRESTAGLQDSSSWLAYSFGDIVADFGSFCAELFETNNYSSLTLFGSQVASVPEIDANTAGIAFALALGLMALVRERRYQLSKPNQDAFL